MRNYKRINRELFQRMPDQFVNRYNEMVDQLNSENHSMEYRSKDGATSIIIGVQPDGSFGIVKWDKEGDRYDNPVVIA